MHLLLKLSCVWLEEAVISSMYKPISIVQDADLWRELYSRSTSPRPAGRQPFRSAQALQAVIKRKDDHTRPHSPILYQSTGDSPSQSDGYVRGNFLTSNEAVVNQVPLASTPYPSLRWVSVCRGEWQALGQCPMSNKINVDAKKSTNSVIRSRSRPPGEESI